MKKLLILDWSEEWRFYLTSALESINCETYLVLSENREPPYFVKDSLVIKDLYEDPLSKLDRIISFIEKNNINAIYTNEDELTELASVIAEKKNFIACPSRVISKSMNKWIVRDELKSVLDMPFYKKISSYNELLEESSDYSFPLVLKPIDGNFSNGAVKINNINSLEDAWKVAYQATFDSPSNSRELILEEYLSDDNRIISCEALIIDQKIEIIGLTEGIQKKYGDKTKNEKFIYDMVIVPAQLNVHIQKKIESQTIQIVRTLGINNCAVHVEFKIDNDEPKFIEINPRLAGGLIPELYKLAYGIDIAKLSLKIAIGERITESELKKSIFKTACLKFIVPNKNGIIKEISFDKKMLESANLDKYNFLLSNGEKYTIGEAYGIGYLIGSSDSRQEIIDKLNQISNNIKVEFLN